MSLSIAVCLLCRWLERILLSREIWVSWNFSLHGRGRWNRLDGKRSWSRDRSHGNWGWLGWSWSSLRWCWSWFWWCWCWLGRGSDWLWILNWLRSRPCYWFRLRFRWSRKMTCCCRLGCRLGRSLHFWMHRCRLWCRVHWCRFWGRFWCRVLGRRLRGRLRRSVHGRSVHRCSVHRCSVNRSNMCDQRLRSRLRLRFLCRGGWSLVWNLLQMLQVMVSFMRGNSSFGCYFFCWWSWLHGLWCWGCCFGSWCWSRLWWGLNRLLWRENWRSSRRWSFWSGRQWLKINWIGLLFLSNPLVRVFPCPFSS